MPSVFNKEEKRLSVGNRIIVEKVCIYSTSASFSANLVECPCI